MAGTWRDWISRLSGLVIPILAVAIAWYSFEIVIQPVLVDISPIFADLSGDGHVGRAPDTPAQAALFATVLLVLFVFFMFWILLSEGVDKFIETCKAILLILAIPLFFIKNVLLSKMKFW